MFACKIVRLALLCLYWPLSLFFEWRRRIAGFEAKGWQTYGVGLVTWIISFWLAGSLFAGAKRMRKTPDKRCAIGRAPLHRGF